VNATDRPALRDALADRPILLDAAMGTRLIAEGLDLASDDPALWMLSHDEAVFHYHRLDIEAGADAIVTNTFGANRAWLDRFGQGEKTFQTNRNAGFLARVAAGPSRYVLGSIGPTASDHSSALIEQAEALLDRRGDVDAFLLETHRLDQAEAALRILRDFPVPTLASLFAWPDPVAESARRLIDGGALAIGANCQVGLDASLALARKLRAVCDHPLFLKPSAGLPGSRLDPPESFAEAVPEWLDLGVRLLGGCCGTTEDHVRAMRRAINSLPSHRGRPDG